VGRIVARRSGRIATRATLLARGPSSRPDSVYTVASVVPGFNMGICRTRVFVCAVLAMAPVVLFLTALAGPAAARTDANPGVAPHRSCSCTKEASRNGVAQRDSVSSPQGMTFIRLSPSGRGGPLSFHASNRVVNIFALDIDHDGEADLIAVHRDRRVRVWRNNGHGQFVRRDGSGLKVSQGSRLLSGDVHPGDALCSPSNGDGGSSVDCARTSAIGLEPAGTNGFESGAQPTKDTFLASTHPRGPPARFA
jgi:hypothetical protein